MGEKTASKWIIEYGSLQALVDKVDTVKGKVGESLRANLSHVILNRDLTELVKDVPLPQTPDTLRMMPWDRDQIHRLFDDLEFRVLRDRLFDTLASADPEVDQGFDVRGGVLERGQLAAWLAEHSTGQRFGLAVVGNHLAFDSDATALAIVSADGEGCYLDTSSLEPGDEAALASWLSDPGMPSRCTRPSSRCTTSPVAGGSWPASPPIPRWPPTWCGRDSAASPSTTWRCATSSASCARKTRNNNNFRCSTTKMASTIRRFRRYC